MGNSTEQDMDESFKDRLQGLAPVMIKVTQNPQDGKAQCLTEQGRHRVHNCNPNTQEAGVRAGAC